MIILVSTAQRATYREVFAVAEFRALWLAQLLSVAGDQLAKVALTVLVYDRTRSSLLAAVTFAVSFVPAFLGGLTLSGLADRLPRRTVMIACDVIRGVLVLAMAVPGMPLAVSVALLFVVSMLVAPFNSARAAVYPDVLAGDRYVIGTAVTLTTYQLAQVVGFAAGGAVVGFFGARPALLVDAATFAVSALLIQVRVQRRPASRHEGARAAPLADMVAGLRLVFTSANLRTLMLFGWVAAFYNVPEGVAAPFARQLHSGAVGVGLLLAAGPGRVHARRGRVRPVRPAASAAAADAATGGGVLPDPGSDRGAAEVARGAADPRRVRGLLVLPGGRQLGIRAGHPPGAAQPGVRAGHRRHGPGPGRRHDRGRRGRAALSPVRGDRMQRRDWCPRCPGDHRGVTPFPPVISPSHQNALPTSYRGLCPRPY